MTISLDAFKDAEVPTDVFPTKENPYRGVVKAIVDSGMEPDDKGRPTSKISKTAVLPFKTEEEKKVVSEFIRLAQLAGKEFNVTVKKVAKEDGKGKVAVTIWAIERITRTKKEAEAEAEAAE